MSLLVQLFQKCLSPDNQIRYSGEQELSNYCFNNFYPTLKEICSIITSNQSPDTVRQFGGTFLKYIFNNESYINLWNNLPQEEIDLVKTGLMGSLASENRNISKTCSLAIAALAKVEIPKGWKVIDVLYNTAHHDNENYRITSLFTLGNILDFLGAKLKQEEINYILGALTNNMDIKLNPKIIETAIGAFKNIIKYIENNFKNEKQRDYIINTLDNIMNINYINQIGLNENVQKDILITFIDIMKYYTIYMQKSFSKIAEISFRYIHCNNQLLSTLAIEIWCTVCDSELLIKSNILTPNYQDTLNNSIIRIIQERPNSFDLTDEWTPTKAAIALINSLIQVKNKKVQERMLTYISECLNNDLLKKEGGFSVLTQNEKRTILIIKQNAFLIYRGVLISEDLSSDIIMSSLQKIIEELKNNNSLPIGESIAICLIVICKYHFDIINNDEKIFDQFLEQILQLLEFHINNKKIELCILYALKNIFNNSKSSYYDKHLANIINILMNIAYSKGSYDKDCNVTLLSTFLTSKIIEICDDTEENKKIIQLFFAKLYSLFEESLNINNFTNNLEQYCYQDCLISIIASCSQFQKITMNKIQIECIFKIIEQTIIQRNGLYTEAISALGSLSYFGIDNFSVIKDKVMQYILIALEDRHSSSLCYQGLLAADDIIRALGIEVITVIPKIVEKIQKIINDPEVQRGLKIKCFPVYNDIFLIPDKSVGEYLNNVMNLLVDGINGTKDPPNKDDNSEILEYYGEFREKIVELLTGVFLFLSEQNQTNIFSQYIDGFIRYLSKIVEPEYNPEINLIAEIAGLLGDLYRPFKAAINLYLNKDSLKIIHQKLEKSDNPEHRQTLLYMEQTFSDFNFNY